MLYLNTETIKYNTQINCPNCDYSLNNIQCTNILIFPLKEIIEEYENRKKYFITIYDCFNYYERENLKDRICNSCRTKDYVSNNIKLMEGPKILIINIYRRATYLMNIKFELDEKVKLKEFIYDNKNRYNYELTSIVFNIGYEQFILFYKSLVENKWYKYDDSLVTESSFKKIKESGVPYLLFYSLIENENFIINNYYT